MKKIIALIATTFAMIAMTGNAVAAQTSVPQTKTTVSTATVKHTHVKHKKHVVKNQAAAQKQ